MKIGIGLHPERGVDAVIEEARTADQQGFDSIWLSDHLMAPYSAQGPEGPLDYFVLMASLAAVTTRTRLSWGVLNVSFRPPAVFAKMLTSLDQISHGRVIAAVGSGWLKQEYEAYDLPLIDEHDERSAYGRDVIRLWKEVWTHPAPEIVNFETPHIHIKNLQFNPEPYQKPHIPIWLGGDSDATIEGVKELADGWIMINAGNPERLSQVLNSPDWPKREMTLCKTGRAIVGKTRQAALDSAEAEYNAMRANGVRNTPATLEDFVKATIIGSADDCLVRLAEFQSWGLNYMRLNFSDSASQDRAAELLLPRLSEIDERTAALV